MGRCKITWLLVAFSCLINLLPVEARAEKKIGILLWSEELHYTDGQKGIMEQLRMDGFGEPAVRCVIENARGSKARAMEVVQRFAAEKMDLIVTLGTSATIIAAKAIKDVPIVFSIVYDPVESGIANSWKSSGNNTTGSSTRLPMPTIVNILREFTTVKRLAVIYTPGEKNSELQLQELQKCQDAYRLKVIPVILNRKEEAARILPEVVRTADAIYLTGSSVVGETVPVIVDMANRGKVVTVTHLDDLVCKGALLGITSNSYHLGRLAGKKIAKILKGAKPSSLPIETDKKIEIMLNKRTAKAGKFQIPSSFMNKVTKTIE